MTRKPRDNPFILSAEDELLWQNVTRSVEPLRHLREQRKPLRPREAGPESELHRVERKPAFHLEAHNNVERISHRQLHPARVQPPTFNSPAGSAHRSQYDPREARKLARGRLDIDARIDLHGLRQAEAHRRLLAFLRSAQAKGSRHVLIVTGKGSDVGHDTLPFVATLDRSPRGVLRRMVPVWLEEPAFAELVVGYREAAAQHGGDGALYVRLRRKYSR